MDILYPSSIDQQKAMEQIRHKLALLPDQPGCYLMKNSEGKIIYVGKAKVLKNRVRSYFSGSHDGKTQKLVSEIRDFEYIVTASNTESLILECNLIKEHYPRYNVLLKDDKSFPYLKITHEAHPRLEVTRRIVKDKGKYFGPYVNAYAATETKKLLDRLYPLRKCNTIPDKVCLYYHMGQCVAPCEFPVDQAVYEEMVGEISRFLNGGHKEIKRELKRKMDQAAEELQFERAREFRDQIIAIESLMEKQTINMADTMDRDVFGYYTDKGWMCVQILYMRQGKMIQRHVSVFPYYGEAYEDFLSYVTQYYSDNPALPREVLLPAPPEPEGSVIVDVDQQSIQESAENDSDVEHEESGEAAEVGASLRHWLKIKVSIPRRGTKRQLIAMACDNSRVALEEKFRLIERDESRTVKAIDGLAKWIGIPSATRIEAFDNSNIQGASPVSAMVVFTKGKPDKKEYRKYNVRSVQGPDDYETMREVVRRRYERVLKEGLTLPDLIVVDGGKGHIASVIDVLVNELGLDIPVCGLAKDAKHRTAQLLVGDPPEVVDLPRDSQEFYLLQRIQDEVHRFAITFHREKRGKSMIASRLDSIPGIGEKRRKQLLSHFGSLKAIKEASVEDFKQVSIGEALAARILETLNSDT